MANLPWPSDISYGRIIGQFAYMDGDSDDKDTTPDMVPAMGTVTITPSVNQVKYNGVEGPKILVPRKILGKLDANGYLVGPDGKQGIVVPSTSNSVLNPSGWTYAVSINITDGGTINLDISLEPGEEKDITTSISIPASGGTVRIIDESTALRAEAAASSVFNIVSEIRDDIEAGKTKGDPGKDAANPNISAQANTTAPGSNAAAAVSGSYPDLTFAFDIPRGDPGKDAANPVITPAVTKIAPGGNPTFNITGTYPNQTYTFGLVTGGKGDKGDPGAVPTAADYTIVGIGRPDIAATMDTTIASKVSKAPIGCEFISTDGPQGAWRWQKTTAGWTVLLGDTGWRDVTGNIAFSDSVVRTGIVRVRRTPEHFIVRVNSVHHRCIQQPYGSRIRRPGQHRHAHQGLWNPGYRRLLPTSVDLAHNSSRHSSVRTNHDNHHIRITHQRSRGHRSRAPIRCSWCYSWAHTG